MHSILDPFYQWSQRNLDLVFFFYGLAFVVMGISIWAQSKKDSEFKLADILWLLAGFGLIHGTNELLDMWGIIKGETPVLNITRSFILIASFLFLFEFGRRLFRICGGKHPEMPAKLFGWWLTPFIGFAVFVFGLASADFWGTSAIWARYLLGFPGGLLISLGLLLYYKIEEGRLGPLKVKKYFYLASLFFLVYGILGGLVASKGVFFPADRINADSFLALVRIPVQAFRAVCAIMIAWAVCGILKIFNWETRNRELARANELLKVEINERKQIEEENKRNYDIQGSLNSLLNFSLKAATVDEVLKYTLELVLSIPWLSFQSKGSIFLVEDDPRVLVMKAQKGISGFLQNACANVPFGKCLCGRAALDRRMVFVGHLDERHEISYEGIMPHGHYCVPIIFSDKVLGVLNIYVSENHARSRKEEDFLAAITNALAQVIVRKKAEEELRKAYLRLSETQDQLIQAEKLNAVGLLASGVAHEVRNPLGIIIQGINYLEKKLSGNPEGLLDILATVKDGVRRADKIIISLLDFSKATALSLNPEDLAGILESSLSLVRGRLEGSNIRVVMEIEPGMPKALADKNKIEQVFINLLLNAIDAMPQGGTITLSACAKELAEPGAGIGSREDDHFNPGERVLAVEFQDTGSGISREDLKRIFDPFFTTKGQGAGTGLGLSVSRNIIHMHKGLIYAQSEPGQGTKVTVILKIAKR